MYEDNEDEKLVDYYGLYTQEEFREMMKERDEAIMSANKHKEFSNRINQNLSNPKELDKIANEIAEYNERERQYWKNHPEQDPGADPIGSDLCEEIIYAKEAIEEERFIDEMINREIETN